MDFSMVIHPGCCETSDNIGVVGHVDLDEVGWCSPPVVVGDGEWDVVGSAIVDITHQSR